LAALDAWFAPLYGQVAQRLTGKDLDALKAHRKAWVKARNDCKAEADGAACLKARYQEFTADLERQFAGLVGGDSGAQVATAAAARISARRMLGAGRCEGLSREIGRDRRRQPCRCRGQGRRHGGAARSGQTKMPISATASPRPTSPGAPIATPNASAASRPAAATPTPPPSYSSCLVEMTRARVRELQM
jgi:uncharacterized protein YecT (DUF1311 family)